MGQRVRIDISGCIFAALILLVLPLKWVTAAFAAAMIHEVCHIVVLKLLGGQFLYADIGIGGARIVVMPMEPMKELLCAAAGPAGSLAVAFIYPYFPRLAVCAGVQAIFNLLPIDPLDGFRIMRCAVHLVTPSHAEVVLLGAEWITVIAIFVAGIFFTFWLHQGVMPLILAGIVIMRAYRRKIPCKDGRIGVQ